MTIPPWLLEYLVQLIGSVDLRCMRACLSACVCPCVSFISLPPPLLSKVPPAPPTGIRGMLSEDSATQIDISWDYFGDSDFVVSFTVYRQTSGTTSWIFVSTITDASVTSHTDSGVLPFTEYRFRVDVTDQKGQEQSAYSGYYTTFEAGMWFGGVSEGRMDD